MTGSDGQQEREAACENLTAWVGNWNRWCTRCGMISLEPADAIQVEARRRKHGCPVVAGLSS